MRCLLASLMLLAAVGPAGADPACLSAPYAEGTSADQRHIAALLDQLAPTLASAPGMADALAQLRPAICLETRTDATEGYFEPDPMRIVLRRDEPGSLQAGILLHELRHLEQYARGICPADSLGMEEHARAVLALEADASAVSLLLAWERLMAGDPAIWEALMNWPSQADIAVAMAREFFRSGDPAQMAAVAFAQWFDDPERRDRYWRASCSDYLDRLDRDHLLPQYGLLAEDFPALLCRLPLGGSYPCLPLPAR